MTAKLINMTAVTVLSDINLLVMSLAINRCALRVGVHTLILEESARLGKNPYSIDTWGWSENSFRSVNRRLGQELSMTEYAGGVEHR